MSGGPPTYSEAGTKAPNNPPTYEESSAHHINSSPDHAPPPSYVSVTSSPRLSAIAPAQTPTLVNDLEPLDRNEDATVSPQKSNDVTTMPLPQAYKPPANTTRKRSPHLSATSLPHAYVPPPSSRVTESGFQIRGGLPRAPMTFRGTRFVDEHSGALPPPLLPAGQRMRPLLPHQASVDDEPPPSYSRSTSTPPVYSFASMISSGATSSNFPMPRRSRQRNRSSSNPAPPIKNREPSSVLQFMAEMSHGSKRAASPPPYSGRPNNSLKMGFERSLSPPPYGAAAATLESVDPSLSPPAYDDTSAGTQPGDNNSTAASQDTNMVAIDTIPPPLYSPPSPKETVIYPPIFCPADNMSHGSPTSLFNILRRSTMAVKQFYIASRRSQAQRTATQVQQFKNCHLSDFEPTSFKVIGRGSNGLVLRASIRQDSPHFDRSLWGRQYALKRRFLYTSPATFRAEFTTPFRHQHNNMLSIYGSFTGRVVEPNAIEQAHLSGKEPLYLRAGEVPSQKQAVDSELQNPSAPDRAADTAGKAFGEVVETERSPAHHHEQAASPSRARLRSGSHSSVSSLRETENELTVGLDEIALRPSTVPANHVEYVVMDLSTNGDLSDVISAKAAGGERLPEPEVLKILYQVALAVAHLHGHGIAHRDIKCENILLYAGRCALSDFGACLSAEDKFRSAEHNGNPNAVPPEVAHAHAQGSSVEADYSGADTWALGIMLYEMLALPSPIKAGEDSRSFRPPAPRLPNGYARCQVFTEAVLTPLAERPSPADVVSLLGRLIWIPGKPVSSYDEKMIQKAIEDAGVAFEAFCGGVVRRLEADGRLAGFEQESALCFYDDEEEEMQVSFVVHELHRCT